MSDLLPDSVAEPTEILSPSSAAQLAGESLGELLVLIAESASIPLRLPPGVVRGMLPKHFLAAGEWKGWTVAAVYDKHNFALLVGFMTPKGNKLSLYDWPDCQDRELLMAWRPKG